MESHPALQDEASPEALLDRKQDGEFVRLAIGSLPEAYRQALLLRCEQGLSYREIAACAGLPAGTVMSRLCRARRQLAECLGPQHAPRQGARVVSGGPASRRR
jgi:RNA polymerase sigma-70 factor (ECF subfamily)